MLEALEPKRSGGFLPLEHYAAIGEGRSVALVGADGSIDWWCPPDMDSPPLFNRLHDADGGRFSLTPVQPFSIERRYRKDSNVLETTFVTETGKARVTESINSGAGGRLPWCEVARRIEGLSGQVEFEVVIRPICAQGKVRRVNHPNAAIRYIGDLTTTFCHPDEVSIVDDTDQQTTAHYRAEAGSRACIAYLVADKAPLAIPALSEIDDRIDFSDDEWQRWTEKLSYDGPFKSDFIRCALSLKFLLYSKTGAIAAAATSGLPERIGGDKNYDYRYAWVRDAAYTIKAFLRAGALSEAIAAFGWLIRTIDEDGPAPSVVYTLSGGEVPDERVIEVPGYKGSTPVRTGNRAKNQVQLSCYGDLLETASLFAEMGHVLDPSTARLIQRLADQVVDRWQEKDSGLWELEELQHHTFSKVGCWLALDRAARLARHGHIDGDADRWVVESDKIRDWIDTHCWSETKKAYTFYAGTEKLDAALLLTTRFGFEHEGRLAATRNAIQQELAVGPLVYRYSGASGEEGAFVACSCWLVEAFAFLGEVDQAERMLEDLLVPLGNNFGVLCEQIDPQTGAGLGNLPQGLSHLTLLHAIFSLQENR
ncbi:glycosyl hydrolase [Rhizobium wenxiniae]|uniref:GH15 family glucan-1,4-alpha-glucosidase n=1 Tax=Rhizobium wenxiniae TaxID=1737357 RepID=A0A7X0D335_9HYPH|nr:glycoside hydrolase family 15 protein [Rhizobium wenxiniae]MBB6166137.1 GH15 family glucan-1,4-alpha-glucosidase [Rhizobium wenxiniae]GGG21894.1 glycosyl hydrolase [Rhizobium wenxiniae]